MRRFSALAIAVCSMVLLGACGSSTSDVAPQSSTVSEVASAQVSDVSARIIGDGSAFSLQEAVAELPVAFWFWAPG